MTDLFVELSSDRKVVKSDEPFELRYRLRNISASPVNWINGRAHFRYLKPETIAIVFGLLPRSDLEQHYRLSYNALTRQYRLSFGSLHQNFDTLGDALTLVGRLRRRFVVDAEALGEGTVYEAAIRMRLDVSQLPKPFQINALASRDWNLSSEWFRWTLKR